MIKVQIKRNNKKMQTIITEKRKEIIMEEERLQKYLANQGIGSRRKCEQYILEGKVTVNGKTIKELGTKINPEKDEICYNGKKVNKQEKKVYILLNKPIGYVTTVKDQFNRDTVMDLIKIKERIYE